MAFDGRIPLPDEDDYDRECLGFVNELLQEATNRITACEGYSRIEPAMRAILGSDTVIAPKERSHTSFNEVGRAAEIAHAQLTDTKLNSDFRTFNADYASYAEDFSKLHKIWYYNNNIDLKYGFTIDWAMVGGSGYAHQIYNKAVRDIDVLAYAAPDVRPVDPVDTTIQSCFGVFIVRAVPLTWAKSMFPHLATQLERDAVWEPASRVPEFNQERAIRAKSGSSPHFAANDTGAKTPREGMIRVVHLHWFYFNDPTINDSSDVKLVGDFDRNDEPRTLYSYRVEPNDELYPRKRLIIHSKNVLCYDGPNHYIHGMFPVSKYTMVPWPYTWLGATPVWDVLAAQDSLTHALRVLDDHIRRSLRPPVSGDRNTAMSELQRISELIAMPGATWQNGPNTPIKVEELPQLDQQVLTMIEMCLRKIPERLGITNTDALTKLAQMPGKDTIDALAFNSEPAIRLRSRMLEIFYREQGRMYAFNAVQFYDVRKKFRSLGSTSIKPTDYDYDPATFIPRTLFADNRTKLEVMIEFCNMFDLYVEPSSLLRTAAQQQKVEAMAMLRLGALDPETFLERMDQPNIPKIMDRLQQFWEKKAALAAKYGASGRGGDGDLPTRPIGGDPRGRKPEGNNMPQLNSRGEMDYT